MKKQIKKPIADDDKISSDENDEINVNNSPTKKKKKLRLEISDEHPSIESEILDERNDKVKRFVHENVLSAKKQPKQTILNNQTKPFKENEKEHQQYRFTIGNNNNRQSFLPIKEQNYFQKQKSYNFNNDIDYNLTNEEVLMSKKLLSEHLKNIGSEAGDYIEVKLESLCGFSPVYKVVDLGSEMNGLMKERKISDDIMENNSSWFKGKNVQQNIAQQSKANRRKSLSVSNPINNQQQSNFELTMGSKILLKHEKFNHLTQFTIKKLYNLPLLNGIYVNIYIKDQGYLICSETGSILETESENLDNNDEIMIDENLEDNENNYNLEFDDNEDGDKIQCIWRCTLAEMKNNKYERDHISEEEISQSYINNEDGEKKYIVTFMNLQSGMFLKIGDDGKLGITNEKDLEARLLMKSVKSKSEESQKFIVKRLPTYGRKYDSENQTKYIPYEQSKQQRLSADNLQFSFELTIIDESVATLQQELLYIKSKLKNFPSLKLIEVILETMLPYLIPEFLPNIGIVSEYIQKMFYDEKITQKIVDVLVKWVGMNSEINKDNDGLENIQEGNEDDDENNIYETHKKNNPLHNQPYPTFSKLKSQNSKVESKYFEDEKTESLLFLKISKYLNRLCRNSKQNTLLFFPLVDIMFEQPEKFYSQIIALVSGNILFVSQFYRREWYQKLIMSMLGQHNKYENDGENDGYERYFMIASSFCQSYPYPSTENQFLLLHTINQPEFESRNILLNLYVEGQYIFVRDKEKDMELLTFLESKGSNIMGNFNNRLSQESVRQSIMSLAEYRGSKRFSLLQNCSTFLESLHKVLFYLQTVSLLTFGHNHTILKTYNPIIQKLLSYCNKQSHLVIKDYDFTRWVLKCACSFYHFENNIKIFPRFRLGIVDNPSGEAKFKQKIFISNFGLMTVNGKMREHNRNIIRIDEKQSLELCNSFLNKCKEYYLLIKTNKIKISELFETKAINGEPIEEYFDFLKMIFSNRLLKFKEKKKAQFMQYIEKLFENVFPQTEKIEQGEESLIITFVKFLLRIISYDEKYQNYLEKLKITTNYHENILHNQLNINKKSTIKKIRILSTDGECSKIMRVKLLNNFFVNEGRKKLHEGDDKLVGNNSHKYNMKAVMKSETLNMDNYNIQQNGPLHNINQPIFKTFEEPLNTNNKKSFSRNEPTELYKNSTNANWNLTNFMSGKTERIPDTSKPLQLLNSPTSFNIDDTIVEKDLMEEYEYQEKFLTVKRKALELIVVIMKNINEEFIEESIETLNYFIKNPTRLNLSSFELFESIPKYDTEFSLRRRVMEQWYLTSEPETFELLTTVLRMLHRKVTLHLNNISLVQIFTDPEFGEMSTFISDNCREVEKLSLSLQSWFREQLYVQNVDMFGYFDEKLENVVETLSKCRQLTDCGCVSVTHQLRKLIVSLNCFEWTKRLLSHISKELNHLKHITSSQPTNIHLPKTRLTTIRTYYKAILSYLEKLSFIITFLTETIPLEKLMSSSENTPIYSEEYESTLHYMHSVICLLGEELAEIDNTTRHILIRIVQSSRECYNINMLKYFTFNIWEKLLTCKWTVNKIFILAEHFNEREIVELAINCSKVFNNLMINERLIINENKGNNNNKEKEHFVYDTLINLIYGPEHHHNINNKEHTNHSPHNPHNQENILFTNREELFHNNNKSEQQNSFYLLNKNKTSHNTNSFLYFIYRLIMLCKRHLIANIYHIPLCRMFLDNFLYIVIEEECQYHINHKNSDNNSMDILKHNININNSINIKRTSQNYTNHQSSSSSLIKEHQVKIIANENERKRYLVFMISQYCEESEKESTVINTNSYYNNNKRATNMMLIRKYILLELTNITIYEQLEKTLQSFHHANKINTTLFYELTSLLLEYLEFYCYDLLSLGYLLEVGDEFEIIYNNLTKINDRLRSFLVEKSSEKIETYYTQSTIMKVIKCFEEQKPIQKMKQPRSIFEPSIKLPKHLSLTKQLHFMTNKQIKKLESTALRKWKKAIKSLEETSLISETEFLYEIDHFSEIYTIKNKEELSSVINNEDLLKKLLSTICNLKRTIKQTENKIFLLIEINKLIESKYFSHLINVEETREMLAEMILEQLNEEEVYEGGNNGNNNSYTNNHDGTNKNNIDDTINNNNLSEKEHWTESVFVICLKLHLLKNLEYFANQFTLASLEILILIMNKAQQLYFEDLLKLKITENEFKETQYLELEPFYIILGIIIEQITFESLGDRELELVLECVYEAVVRRCWDEEIFWLEGEDRKGNSHLNNRLHIHKRLHLKLIEKISKEPRSQMILNTISRQFLSKSINTSEKIRDNKPINKLEEEYFHQSFYEIEESYYFIMEKIERSSMQQSDQLNNYYSNSKFTTILGEM